MKKKIWILFILGGVALGVAWFEPTGMVRGRVRGELFFQSRPTSYWTAALTSADPMQQVEAEEQLAAGGAKAAALLDQMLREQLSCAPQVTDDEARSIELRVDAITLLGKIGPDAQAFAPTLLELTNDADPHVRTVAAVILPQIDTPAEQAVPALVKLLEQEPKAETSRAISAYGRQAAPALNVLVGIMNNTQLPSDVRWEAVRTVGKMREAGAPAIADLVNLLDDEAQTVREHAAEALGDIGPPAAGTVTELIAVMTDSYWKVRRDVARSLGQIGVSTPEVIAALEGLAADPDENVRGAAKTALEALNAANVDEGKEAE